MVTLLQSPHASEFDESRFSLRVSHLNSTTVCAVQSHFSMWQAFALHPHRKCESALSGKCEMEEKIGVYLKRSAQYLFSRVNVLGFILCLVCVQRYILEMKDFLNRRFKQGCLFKIAW